MRDDLILYCLRRFDMCGCDAPYRLPADANKEEHDLAGRHLRRREIMPLSPPPGRTPWLGATGKRHQVLDRRRREISVGETW